MVIIPYKTLSCAAKAAQLNASGRYEKMPYTSVVRATANGEFRICLVA